MNNKRAFQKGMRDGIPIGLGYLAVSFSLGITAKNIGLTPFQGFLVSFLNNASAGEYAGFTVIATDGAYMEIVFITLITNIRYLLMSCALSQKFLPGTSFIHRFIIGYDTTDELFGITIAQPGYLNPYYTYGAMLLAIPGWSLGTAIGVMAGTALPQRIVGALSVALFGMFIAIIIPPARKNKIIAGLVVISFLSSYCFTRFSNLSEGSKTIILTAVISALAALLFPVKQTGETDSEIKNSGEIL